MEVSSELVSTAMLLHEGEVCDMWYIMRRTVELIVDGDDLVIATRNIDTERIERSRFHEEDEIVCPWCGEILMVESDDGTMFFPQEWLEMGDLASCDGCGELRMLSRGEIEKGTFNRHSIDPPEELFYCKFCVERREP